MSDSPTIHSENSTPSNIRFYSRKRVFWGLGTTITGFIIFLIGARPGLFGQDHSPVIGFVQISFFTIGLGIICLGGYIGLKGLWKDRPLSISADIGARLVATGFVISGFCAMADILGFGSQGFPHPPFFGPLQAGGVMIGEGMITVGFVLMIPFNSRPNKAS